MKQKNKKTPDGSPIENRHERTIADIKEALKKSAVVFHTGGKRPADERGESWIGRVCLKWYDEEVPLDSVGDKMLPLATFFLKNLPFCPDELAGIELITIFMSENVWDNLENDDLSAFFSIQMYRSLDELEPCDYISEWIKPFPLAPQLVENDFPAWDSGNISTDLEDIILGMEKAGTAEYYDDIHEETYEDRKIGGYPAFCQPGH